MLSYALWQSRFGGERDVVGRQVMLNGKHYTIAGVMPKSFQFPLGNHAIDAWTSIAAEADGPDPTTSQRGQDQLDVIGRLKPGVTEAQARADLSAVARGLAAQYSDTNKWYTSAKVMPELEFEVGKTRPALVVLFGAVAVLLLIACVNVAGLLLVRSSRRSGEIALRGALGASRGDIVWQLLTESLVLSLMSGLGGIALASGILKSLVVLFPAALPRLGEVSLDIRVMTFGRFDADGSPVRSCAGAARRAASTCAGAARWHAHGDERTWTPSAADLAGDRGDGAGVGSAGGSRTADPQLRECTTSGPGVRCASCADGPLHPS
jgi:putative ABC transport system permease protein